MTTSQRIPLLLFTPKKAIKNKSKHMNNIRLDIILLQQRRIQLSNHLFLFQILCILIGANVSNDMSM